SKQNRQECKNTHQVKKPFSSQCRNKTSVNYKGIDHNTNQSPSFFRIPSPVTSPTFVCPLSAKEIPYGQHNQSNSQRHFVDIRNLFDVQFHLHFIVFIGKQNQQ